LPFQTGCERASEIPEEDSQKLSEIEKSQGATLRGSEDIPQTTISVFCSLCDFCFALTVALISMFSGFLERVHVFYQSLFAVHNIYARAQTSERKSG